MTTSEKPLRPDRHTQREYLLRSHITQIMSGVRLRRRDAKLLEEDVRRGIEYLTTQQHLGTEEAIERIGHDIFGTFYSPADPDEWYPLDSAAKVYPLSMTHSRMAIYRVGANMVGPVVPELLQLALHSVIKRFPTFATTLKRGMFWHYLDARRSRFVIEQERGLPCSPIKLSSVRDQVFRLVYFGNRISLEVFHCVSDGYGGMMFFRTILAEYLRLLGEPQSGVAPTLDIAEAPDKDELADAFPTVAPSGSTTGFGNGRAIQVKGARARLQPARVIHFNMPSAALSGAAKKMGASVTGLLLSAMFIAAKAASRETKGVFRIQVPVNMRQYYPVMTLRNFSMYAIISIPYEEVGTLEELVPKVTAQLKAKTAKEPLDGMAANALGIVRNPWLRRTPLSLKGLIVGRVTGNITRRSFTAVLSNLGVEKTTAGSIKSFEAICGPSSSNQLGCGIISCGETAVLTITKTVNDNSFETALYGLLTSAGIGIVAGGNNPEANENL